jgi:dTDP-4-dehydrorhamnose 3,5-epimerase-like enzyme
MNPRHASLDSVRRQKLVTNVRADGRLIAMEQGLHVPFPIKRAFVVCDMPAGAERGGHAHKQTNQFLVTTSGCCRVVCDDGQTQQVHLLDKPDEGLWIPPGIWATQTYITANSVLVVLCDTIYDEDDYLRDYPEFLIWRKG